jgi:Fur family transcriptional regulator, ferric uptake regulator
MSPMSRPEIRRRVREAGLRATAPRIAVLHLLSTSGRPLSHTEVVESLGRSDWDQATLYRNLLKLVDANLARVVSRVGGITKYEILEESNKPHLHPHFACRKCGHVECLVDSELSLPSDPRWREALIGADLQAVGTCPKCRSAEGD